MDGDPYAQAHAVYRAMARGELGNDLRLGLNLGFYRTFAVPGIARVLAGTGKMTTRPKARAKATGALIYTLIDHGPHHPAGARAVTTLNHLHAGLPAGDDEFVYVLAAFCVAPIHWIDAHGRRPTTPQEKTSAHAFYADLGQRMNLPPIPGSFDDLEAWMDAYEQRHFAVTPEGRALMRATRNLLTDRFPRALAPLVHAGTNTLFDTRFLEAIGASPPTWPVRALVRAALRVRAWNAARGTRAKESSTRP
ncbi:oxygenase MpaB family protein [Streptomyces albireticuli]|uniref:ER-bound oxygenase mpaB/mpaB'/Rubber oxygenase catalytic domain-containing protein n=1 Tax=Streptomyces albireticuli TaxID=1940 RepID=A0A2A2D5Z0_9ACTN|nr:oxygenase MpaB family protein [Streptomyces albireticuli]MCD9145991.1 DUF2236 domain-containing protein [Streptomyces albireticuli]MCD9165753.1 DUF2236 domain-containing protein [Streptomyces albireticuli]MCD9195971.1 DUF2236 domain-containing protein [Streptomyces albireticuli]PAU46931.1 hypothetical protein CK936_21810 [Streptomyces albireticuli]